MKFEHCIIFSTPLTFLLPQDSDQNDPLYDHLNMANQILNLTKKKQLENFILLDLQTQIEFDTNNKYFKETKGFGNKFRSDL